MRRSSGDISKPSIRQRRYRSWQISMHDSIVPNHPAPAQPKEQPETVKVVDNLASFEEYVVNRMDEIDGQLKALEKEYADLSVTLLTIGRYGEERASVHE